MEEVHEKKEFSMKGELEEIAFPRILYFLCEKGATGRLVLRRGDVTKTVFLVEGKPVNVDSNVRDETLGRYLIKKGKINEEDFDKSIQLMIDSNIQQGAALVKLGCLSPRELYHEVKAQTREKLLSCFGWVSGEFAFHPEVSFVEDIYRFEMTVPSLMHEGIMRRFPAGVAESQLAKVGRGPVVPVAGFMDKIGGFDLDEKESSVVMKMDGKLDLKGIKQACEFEGASKLLYLLLVTGLAGPEGKPDPAVYGMGESSAEFPPVEEFLRPAEHTPEALEEETVEPEAGTGPDIDIPLPDLEEPEASPAQDEQPVAMEEEAPVGPEGAEEPAEEPAEQEAPGVEAGPAEDEIIDELDQEVEELEVEAGPMDSEPAPVSSGPEAPQADEEEVEEVVVPPLPPRDETDILEAYMGIKSSDFFELLDVGKDAGDAEVERAYRKKRAEWDKGRFESISSEAQAKLEEINTRFIRAYESLRTGDLRKEYRAKVEKESREQEVKPSLVAERFLQEGMKAVRTRDWPQAQAMFEKAVEAKPDEPEYKSYLGWAIYSNPRLPLEDRKARAKELLEAAINHNPNLDSPHVFMGKILKDEGKPDYAESEFRAALSANPRCREAERELKARQQGEW